jgi:Glycosyl transferase family 2
MTTDISAKSHGGAGRIPRISVILPVYNGELFLREAVDSILEQSFADFELIAIDDGSLDSSGAILDRIAKADDRVTALHQANAGVVATLNRGLALARGEFIARMDADDVAHPQRFTRQVAFLDAHPDVAALGCAVTLIDDGGKRIRDIDYPGAPEAVSTFLETGSALAHPSVMMRRDAVRSVGGYRAAYRHAEDYDLWLRMAERYRLANLAERLLLYRSHETKLSFTYPVEQALATSIARLAARCRRAGKPDPTEGLQALAAQDIDRFNLTARERAGILLDLAEAVLASDPAMAKPDTVRQATELMAVADVPAADSLRLVRAMLILSRGFAGRGQPLLAGRWLGRAITGRRTGLAQVAAIGLGWAKRRAARLGRALRVARG